MKHNIIKLFFFLFVATTPIVIGFLETVNAQDLLYKTINDENYKMKKEVNSAFNQPYSSFFPIIQEAEKTANALANKNIRQVEQQKIRLREIMIQQAKRKRLRTMPTPKYQYKQLSSIKKSHFVSRRSSPYFTANHKKNTSLVQIAMQAEKTADAFTNKNLTSMKRNKEKLVEMMIQTTPKNK